MQTVFVLCNTTLKPWANSCSSMILFVLVIFSNVNFLSLISLSVSIVMKITTMIMQKLITTMQKQKSVWKINTVCEKKVFNHIFLFKSQRFIVLDNGFETCLILIKTIFARSSCKDDSLWRLLEIRDLAIFREISLPNSNFCRFLKTHFRSNDSTSWTQCMGQKEAKYFNKNWFPISLTWISVSKVFLIYLRSPESALKIS